MLSDSILLLSILIYFVLAFDILCYSLELICGAWRMLAKFGATAVSNGISRPTGMVAVCWREGKKGTKIKPLSWKRGKKGGLLVEAIKKKVVVS